jgi:hypothetical protein
MLKRLLPTLVIALLSVQFGHGAVPAPQWIQDEWRSARYPSTEWHTGFAKDKAKGSPGKAEYETIEKNAQNKLSESVTVKIQGTTTSEENIAFKVQQTQRGENKSETINRDYTKRVTSTSNAVLAKMETHSYFDEKNGYIYGFAAVRKKDLADFYRSNINSLFAFAEKEFIRLEVLEEQGKKNSAFGRIQVIEDSLKNVSYWGTLLQAVESDNSYRKREQDFWQRINDAKKSLEHGTSVYLDISGISDTEFFAERLGAQMQERQCNCAISENASNADYNVKIRVKLGSCIENKLNNFGEIYCYASANVSVNNLKYKKPLDVKIPDAKGGWGNRNKEKATDEAIKELTNSLAEKIIQSINK